jgi:hypothetical protein
MPDIFISYGREDRPHAERIASVLEERGWSVWWDRKILAGEAFSQTIEKAIDGARCVVVIWSTTSVASSWVRDEATEGSQRNILVPVLIDEIEIPLGFRQLHAVAIGDPATEEDTSKFDDLVAAVDSVLRRPVAVAALRETASTAAPRAQNSGGSPGTVPRWYLHAALAVAAILAVFAVWGRFGVDNVPIGGSNSESEGSSGAGSPPVGGTMQATGAARTPDPGAPAPAPAAVRPLSSGDVSDSPAEAAGIVVSGKGQDFYTVFDSAGVKQLSYAKTETPIELFPGDYVVDLHGIRRSVSVAPGRRTNLQTGTISVSGTGADFYEVHPNTGKPQLGYAKTNGVLEMFPGDYTLVLHGVSTGATVRAGRDTTVGAGRVMVPGSGSTFYTVYDAKGEKQLAYAKTNVEIELLPGAYVIEMNNTRRSAQVGAGNRTVIDR